MKPVCISSLTFLPVFTSFKHDFLARPLISAYQCRGYLHDNVASKFTEKKDSRRLTVESSLLSLLL